MMKKSYTILLILLFSNFLFAQSLNLTSSTSVSDINNTSYDELNKTVNETANKDEKKQDSIDSKKVNDKEFNLQTALKFETDSTKQIIARYGSKGFEFQTRDNKFLLQIQSRLQFRISAPHDQDPVTYEEVDSKGEPDFKINRARLKVGGHAFQPWLKYYWEYELGQSNLLDFRLMIEKWKWLSFKVGQWKIEYSQERMISSGHQQTVERSLINRPFTVDRQQGVEIYGQVGGKGMANFNYSLAVLTGTGRGNRENDDNNLMYFGRFQWNFLGEELEFSGSDLEFHEKPSARIAIAGVTNRSPYTKFSQSGGGRLEDFQSDNPGQYRVNQYNIESALMYKGFSWQSEWHHKQVKDYLDNKATTKMSGYYLQAGYFFHGIINWVPKNLEFATRFAEYRPNNDFSYHKERGTTFAFNWFFKGHSNKLTAELSYFDFFETNLPKNEGWRFRLQWDISI